MEEETYVQTLWTKQELTDQSPGPATFLALLPWKLDLHFLNKLSNAARALLGRRLAGVEVSFSRVTRIS